MPGHGTGRIEVESQQAVKEARILVGDLSGIDDLPDHSVEYSLLIDAEIAGSQAQYFHVHCRQILPVCKISGYGDRWHYAYVYRGGFSATWIYDHGKYSVQFLKDPAQFKTAHCPFCQVVESHSRLEFAVFEPQVKGRSCYSNVGTPTVRKFFGSPPPGQVVSGRTAGTGCRSDLGKATSRLPVDWYRVRV